MHLNLKTITNSNSLVFDKVTKLYSIIDIKYFQETNKLQNDATNDKVFLRQTWKYYSIQPTKKTKLL